MDVYTYISISILVSIYINLYKSINIYTQTHRHTRTRTHSNEPVTPQIPQSPAPANTYPLSVCSKAFALTWYRALTW